VIVAAVAAVVVALLAALLIADRVAVIHAQGRIAARLGDRGFAARPQVTIAGFPFLTQLAARRLDKVVISAAGKKLGPVEVRRLDVTLHGIRARPGCDGRTASRLSGSARLAAWHHPRTACPAAGDDDPGRQHHQPGAATAPRRPHRSSDFPAVPSVPH
jgi:hypothetical protein